MFCLFASSLSEMAVTGLQQMLNLKSETVKRFGVLGASESRNDIGLIMETGFHVNTTFHLFFFCSFLFFFSFPSRGI